MASFLASKPNLLHKPGRSASLSRARKAGVRRPGKVSLPKPRSGGARSRAPHVRPPRKVRTALRAGKIAWLVLYTEARLAWRGGRLAERVRLRRDARLRGGRPNGPLRDRRVKLAVGGVAGLVTLRLLIRRRRRCGPRMEPADPPEDQLSLTLDGPDGPAANADDPAHAVSHSGQNENGNGSGAGAAAAL